VDTDGRILKLNHATLRASGYEDEADVRGKYFWDVFIDEAEREAMTGRFAAAAPDYPPTEYENTFTNLRGERLVIYWRSTPVVDEHGKVVSIVAAGLDITERHRLEAEKEREREFLNAIANNAPSLICLIDDEGRVTDQGANMAFERTLERDPSDIGGEIFWMRYVHPGDADEVRERIERVVAGEALGEHDNYWVTGTGRRLLMAWTCTPLPALDERRLFLITGVDVTERNRREPGARGARLPADRRVDDPEPPRHRRLQALIVENSVNRAFTDTFGWSGWESTGAASWSSSTRKTSTRCGWRSPRLRTVSRAPTSRPAGSARPATRRSSPGRRPPTSMPRGAPGCSSRAWTSPNGSGERRRSGRARSASEQSSSARPQPSSRSTSTCA
jgi:PAS domain S-box-containing protein